MRLMNFARCLVVAMGALALEAHASERVALPGVVVIEAGSSLQAISDNATAVTYTIFGAEVSSSIETPKRLAAPGFITTSTAPILSPTVTSVVTLLVLDNTTGATATGIKLFVGGSSTVNQMLGALDLCAHCTATLSADGWRVISDKGELLQLGGGGGGGGGTYFAGTCLSMTGTTINFAPGVDCSFNNHQIKNLSPGSASTDGVNLQQLTAAVQGRHIKDPADWCSTGNISLSGLGTQANGEWTTPLSGAERIIVRLQTSSPNDGIYTPTSGAWIRATDADDGTKISDASIYVTGGATCQGDTYTQSLTVTTIGADPQSWILTGEGSSHTGDGVTIDLVGTQFKRKAITGDIACADYSATCTLPNIVTGATATKTTFNAKGQVTGSAAAQLASSDFVNQGTVNGVLHGNAAGNPAFGPVASADLSITPTTCTNQHLSAISAGGVGTCTTDLLASAQHANQGTVTTVLHGNAAGNPAFGAVDLSADTAATKLPLAKGGSNADLSATGGASQVLKQVTVGAPVTVGQLGCSDLAGVGTGCAAAVSGSNTGDVTLAAVGAAPNANGASLSGQILTLQPASTALPGLMTADDKRKSSGCNLGSDVTTSGTAAFTLLSCQIDANTVAVGDTFQIRISGVTSGSGNPTWSTAIGTTNPGTTVTWTTAAMTSAAASGGGFDVACTVKSIGALGSMTCSGVGFAAALIASSASATAQTINTTVNWFITARVAMSTLAFRATNGSIKKV